MARIFQLMLMSMTRVKNIGFMVANINQKDLLYMVELIQTGKVRPIIDKRFPLTETAEALRYLEEGQARGKIIISVS